MADLSGPIDTELAPKRLSSAYQSWYRFSRNPTAVIGAVIVVFVHHLSIGPEGTGTRGSKCEGRGEIGP